MSLPFTNCTLPSSITILNNQNIRPSDFLKHVMLIGADGLLPMTERGWSVVWSFGATNKLRLSNIGLFLWFMALWFLLKGGSNITVYNWSSGLQGERNQFWRFFFVIFARFFQEHWLAQLKLQSNLHQDGVHPRGTARWPLIQLPKKRDVIKKRNAILYHNWPLAVHKLAQRYCLRWFWEITWIEFLKDHS